MPDRPDKDQTLRYLQSVGETDLKQALRELLEMVENQVEAGNVQSLVVLFAGDMDDERANYGGRHVIRARHMDFLEESFKAAMDRVTAETGISAQSMREARAEALERKRNETK